MNRSLTDSGMLLLENSNNEDYYIVKQSSVRRTLYNINLHLRSIHQSSPIIVDELGKEKKPELLALTNYPASEEREQPPSDKQVPPFNHVVLWSSENHCVMSVL